MKFSFVFQLLAKELDFGDLLLNLNFHIVALVECHRLGFAVLKPTPCECGLHRGVKVTSRGDKAAPDVCAYVSSVSKHVNKTGQKQTNPRLQWRFFGPVSVAERSRAFCKAQRPGIALLTPDPVGVYRPLHSAADSIPLRCTTDHSDPISNS